MGHSLKKQEETEILVKSEQFNVDFQIYKCHLKDKTYLFLVVS